jgi:hypothetical protein
MEAGMTDLERNMVDLSVAIGDRIAVFSEAGFIGGVRKIRDRLRIHQLPVAIQRLDDK